MWFSRNWQLAKVFRLHRSWLNFIRNCGNQQPQYLTLCHQTTDNHSNSNSNSNSIRPNNSGLRFNSTNHWHPVPDWIFRRGSSIDLYLLDLTFIRRLLHSSISTTNTNSHNNSSHNISHLGNQGVQEGSVDFAKSQKKNENNSFSIELDGIFPCEAAPEWRTTSTTAGNDSKTSTTAETFKQWRIPQQSDENLQLITTTGLVFYLFFLRATVLLSFLFKLTKDEIKWIFYHSIMKINTLSFVKPLFIYTNETTLHYSVEYLSILQ